MRNFAEAARCRHRQICTHFGETPKWNTCGMCDVCCAVPEWLSAPELEEAVRPRPRKAPPEPVVPAGLDRDLLEYLRQWRRATAKRTGVPAYVVLHDTSLEDLCRKQPSNLRELLRVNGFGERKAELYGQQIFATLDAYRRGARAPAKQQEM